jgi:hypothetical protein
VLTLAIRALLGPGAAPAAAWAASLAVLAIVALACLVLDRRGVYLRI